MKEKILEEVITKLKYYEPENEINGSTPLSELILDSLDWLDFSFKIEREYGIVITADGDDIASLCDNVGDIVDLIIEKINNIKKRRL